MTAQRSTQRTQRTQRRKTQDQSVNEDGARDSAPVDQGEEPEAEPAAAVEESVPETPEGSLNAMDAARIGARHLHTLTGKDFEGVTSVEPVERGWQVEVEVVEDHRIPSSGDILASYEILLDPGGELVSYRRTRRYSRGRAE